jgi:hypothetical protein
MMMHGLRNPKQIFASISASVSSDEGANKKLHTPLSLTICRNRISQNNGKFIFFEILTVNN